jgi:hypothetical protein
VEDVALEDAESEDVITTDAPGIGISPDFTTPRITPPEDCVGSGPAAAVRPQAQSATIASDNPASSHRPIRLLSNLVMPTKVMLNED